jgi:hypothetical protein
VWHHRQLHLVSHRVLNIALFLLGGHTTEMLMLIQKLPWFRHGPAYCVLAQVLKTLSIVTLLQPNVSTLLRAALPNTDRPHLTSESGKCQGSPFSACSTVAVNSISAIYAMQIELLKSCKWHTISRSREVRLTF